MSNRTKTHLDEHETNDPKTSIWIICMDHLNENDI